ncbi:MAG: hypothetical protein CSA75_03890, partial [Sorangium cellulosum]
MINNCQSCINTAFCIGLLACSAPNDQQVPIEKRSRLRQGIVATVGSIDVTSVQVASMVRASDLSPEQARSRLEYDALMAAGAVARGYEKHDSVVVRRRSVLARTLLNKMMDEAKAEPISDEEVTEYTQLHWLDIDRPVARRTTHAVVMPKDKGKSVPQAKLDAVATEIATAVRATSDPAQFKRKAEAVDHEGVEVLIQDLAPVTSDGRVADLVNRPMPGQPTINYDRAFTEAVFRIADVGMQSTLVRSKFGTHVILLTEIQAGNQMSFAERKKALTPEIWTGRVHRHLKALLETLRSQ